MRIAMCLMKRLGWWCEYMQSFKNNYLVATIPLKEKQKILQLSSNFYRFSVVVVLLEIWQRLL